jgi:hypothetical protein
VCVVVTSTTAFEGMTMKARAMSGRVVKLLAVPTFSTIVGLTVAYRVLFSGQAPGGAQ